MRAENPGTREQGFTAIELTVVLGLLAGFLVLLTQLLSSGVSLFSEGEKGQELADLSSTAAEATRDCLADMVGPLRESYEPRPPDARLFVEWIALGLPSDPATASRVQALRATVRLHEQQETEMLRQRLRPVAEAAEGSRGEADVDARLEEMVALEPRQGRADMLLIAWPAGDPDGAFLELRRGLFPRGQGLPLDQQREVGLMDADLAELPPELVRQLTAPIAAGLLHVELSFWSQQTQSFERGPDDAGPQWVWDSARAGLLSESEDPRQRFALDLYPESLENTTDDVFPRAVRVVLVVDREGPPLRLAREMTNNDTTLRLLGTEAIDLSSLEYLKIGSEWVRFGGVSGEILTGLRRAQRDTRARAHKRGAVVRTGKTVVFQLELAHGRDDWNG